MSNSLFNQISTVVKKHNAQYHRNNPAYRYCFDMETMETLDKIVLILILSRHFNSTTENESKVIVINHDDYHAWCEETERLQVEGYDEAMFQIGYAEYMQENNCKSDYIEYMISQNLVPDTYEFAF